MSYRRNRDCERGGKSLSILNFLGVHGLNVTKRNHEGSKRMFPHVREVDGVQARDAPSASRSHLQMPRRGMVSGKKGPSQLTDRRRKNI